ncbi:MAG TPA: hypothetical protein VHL31_25810 [Geminicoccus sp.]|jgi:hypothetical protein|uniref:hypothetical protein n=1 Tax=Geminicoccus sp. TaxID=2024832 RepID=UPI002E31140C|nr:hypothetical protein [Geminicoccus sp.]HEX2529692.1 hypothetical protein [Geminicoccus sp.]
MSRLLLDDEITVLPVCQTAGQAPVEAGSTWTGRVREIEGPRVLMCVRTKGGAEVTVEAMLSGFHRNRSGRWQVELPMFHRVMERPDASLD